MRNKADEMALSDLHGMLAEILRQDLLDDGKRTSSFLNVIRQFLKDNNITCNGEDNDVLKDIRDRLPVFSAEDEGLI
jgi:hypothetical protein